jgi:hypothetical protein
VLRGDRALWEFRATGDLAPLRRFVAGLADGPESAEWRLELARRSGDDAAAYALAATFPEFASLSRFQLRGPRDMYLATGVPPHERAALLASAGAVLDRLALDGTDDPALAIYRGWVAALGGDAPAAVANFKRGEAQMAREIDLRHRANLAAQLALGYALAGDADAAQQWLAVCLQAEGGCCGGPSAPTPAPRRCCSDWKRSGAEPGRERRAVLTRCGSAIRPVSRQPATWPARAAPSR